MKMNLVGRNSTLIYSSDEWSAFLPLMPRSKAKKVVNCDPKTDMRIIQQDMLWFIAGHNIYCDLKTKRFV